MTIDLGVAYRTAREEIIRLATTHDAATPVPATPLWSVREVCAHLAGVIEDGRTGNFAGAPGEPWTAAQVERDASKSLEQLIEEWSVGAVFLEEMLSGDDSHGQWHAVADVVTHLADIANAYGEPAALPVGFVPWIGPKLLGYFEESVKSSGLESISLTTSDWELFRARFGRRTLEEVRAYDWSHDPSAYLEKFFIFGVAKESLHELQPVQLP